MKVILGQSEKTIIGEMVDAPEIGSIAEMITDASKLDAFQPGWSAKGASLAEAAEDDKPNFVVIRVEEGWSNNKRLWDGNELDSIVSQTNALEPVGHLGHIPDDQAGFAMPEPQTTWFGAVAKTEASKQKDRVGEMVKVGYFAGYNLPGAKVRTYIKTRAVRGISWWGSGEQVPIPGKGVQVRGFVLKALDWARKGSEGMPTARVVASVKEMEDKMEKTLAQVTPEEFKKENPNGYALLVSEATAEKDAKIGEMEAQVEEGEKAKGVLDEIRKALKLDANADPLAAIASLMSTLGEKAKEVVQSELDKILAEKVPDENKRKLVMRLLPVGEMETKVSDAKPEDAAKMISEMVDETFDKDETIKTVVGEMQPPTVRRREEFKQGGAAESAGFKRERTLV